MRVLNMPGLVSLTWLLFMRPRRLREMLNQWEIGGEASLTGMWPLLRARDPVALALSARLALVLFLGLPLLIIGGSSLLHFAGNPTNFAELRDGLLGGFAHVWSETMLFGVALGIMFGVTVGVVPGFAVGVLVGVLLGEVVRAMTGWLPGTGPALSQLTAVTVSLVVFGTVVGATRLRDDRPFVGVFFVLLTAMLALVLAGFIDPAAGVKISVVLGVVWLIAVYHLHFWPLEVALTAGLTFIAYVAPRQIPRLARCLPFRHHDLLSLPLPWLHSFIVVAAESHQECARELMREAKAHPAQRRIGTRASIELQARALERAAKSRLFVRAAALDFPFLPPKHSLASSSPLRDFQAAAQNLDAGMGDHVHRRRALERAHNILKNFIAEAKQNPSDALTQRLIRTARQWAEVVADEYHRLRTEEAVSPLVPRAFIAGPPLSPEQVNLTLFKGRMDLVDLIAHDLDPNRHGVLIVIGQRRMGKSSLRNWLPRLLGTGTLVIPVDFQSLSGHPHCRHPYRWLVSLVHAAFPNFSPPPESDRWIDALEWLRTIDSNLEEKRIILVIDEVERVEDGIRQGWCSTDFLDFLRAAGDAFRRLRFLLLTAHPLHRLGPHWIDRLISATTRIMSYLDDKSAEELVRAPIPDFPDIYPVGGVERILRETHRHPFLIQKTCDELCKYLNARGGMRRATHMELQDVLDTIVDEKLFDELWNQRTADEKRALQELATPDGPPPNDRTARSLAREGIVQFVQGRPTIAVPLFAYWIREMQGTFGMAPGALGSG